MMSQTKIAIVTGGSRGLGKEMALSLGRKNIDVILTYHSRKSDAEQVVSQLKAMGRQAAALPLDVGNIASFNAFLSAVQDTLRQNWNADKFDHFIHNGGIGATLPIPTVTEEAFDQLMNIHFKGVYFLTQKAVVHMNDGGCFVFISSGTTRFCVHGYSVYSSMKGAMEVFSKYVAKEFGARGIRSNVVAPGATETDFNNAAVRSNPQFKGYLASATALGRVGQADDIGDVVAFLCTDDAKWVNGQRIEVTGGINL